ncbi:MAG: hypothetical protein M3Z46_07865 [Actinomycetota bacterium]|nr:hypothetical protein [Actinomycetota bacterium]
MPVPFPAPGTERLGPPDVAEVEMVMRGVTTAISPASGLTHLQRLILEAHARAMTGFQIDMDRALMHPLGPIEMADGLADRTQGFRERMVELMMLGELILVPLPDEVEERVERYASEMGIACDMLRATRRLAHGSLGLAALDFDRSGYTSEWDAAHSVSLHTKAALDSAWDASCNDPDLAAQWTALGDLPLGTLGHGVFAFYQARGFNFPGQPGSAPPLLAQHDWVHVLTDYGSTVESELEVFGFISRANDDPRAFSLLAMVINLFETGYRANDAGLFRPTAVTCPAVVGPWRSGWPMRCAAAPFARTSSGPTTASTSWPSTGSRSPTSRSRRCGSASTSWRSRQRSKRSAVRDHGNPAASARSSSPPGSGWPRRRVVRMTATAHASTRCRRPPPRPHDRRLIAALVVVLTRRSRWGHGSHLSARRRGLPHGDPCLAGGQPAEGLVRRRLRDELRGEA